MSVRPPRRGEVQVWSDGSGTASGPGGYAAILRTVSGGGEVVEREVCGGLDEATNNRAELTALLEGLRALKRPCRVVAFVDSEYVMRAFTDGWLDRWRANGWRTSAGRDVSNRDLWEALLEVARPHVLAFEWVRGHGGVELNERADRLAGEERRKLL